MPSDRRIFAIANAMSKGYSVDKIWEMTKIDKWFLNKLARLMRMEKSLASFTEQDIPTNTLRAAKQLGFSDRQIASQLKSKELSIRQLRKSHGITPFVKQIDTGMCDLLPLIMLLTLTSLWHL